MDTAMFLVLGVSLLSAHAICAQDRALLSTIPRVDVHAHLGGDVQLMEGYLEIAGILKDKHDANLDIWIDLGSYKKLEKLTVDKFDGAGFYPGPGEGTKEVKGMALPVDVLEKIYYKNAVRLYPGVKDVLQQMGYAVE